MQTDFAAPAQKIAELRPIKRLGTIRRVNAAFLEVGGLTRHARIGDLVAIKDANRSVLEGEIIALDKETATVMTHSGDHNCAIGEHLELICSKQACPDPSWAGRIVDAFGQPIDGKPLKQGTVPVNLKKDPPSAGQRRALGQGLSTGLAVTDTFLTLTRGQRIGVFAGSGVGKTSLLGALARGIEADIVVIALIGERGRELRDFVDKVLGPEGMKRAVIVTATSDQSPLLKRRAAWMAMSIAEVFRDMGQHVLLILDSLTRFAEAHREVALTAGEAPSLRAFPPSTANMIAALTERAGTGAGSSGDITAVFSVLVAGSDMEEPVADFARGVLDGHIVLDRAIAERGRFPAIDVLKSVSRALPDAASPADNELLTRARAVLSTFHEAETLIRTGLYVHGTDPQIDHAIELWPAVDRFISETDTPGISESYALLRASLGIENEVEIVPNNT